LGLIALQEQPVRIHQPTILIFGELSRSGVEDPARLVILHLKEPLTIDSHIQGIARSLQGPLSKVGPNLGHLHPLPLTQLFEERRIHDIAKQHRS